MTPQPDSPSIPPRSSLNPHRRSLHLNLTAREYGLISERAAAANLSRPRYVREIALAFEIYRTTSPAELMTMVTKAIACVHDLAISPAVRLQFKTWRQLEAALAELDTTSALLEVCVEYIAAALALRPPDLPAGTRHLPGPGASIWLESSPRDCPCSSFD